MEEPNICFSISSKAGEIPLTVFLILCLSFYSYALDDLVMWINGGPGCTSSFGVLFELGPCSIDMSGTSPNGTIFNPLSWNREANIFFLDQPTFKDFSNRPLHLAGESYAGRYLPVFASEIYDNNQVALAQNREVVNLQSILIGNGITDISTLYEGRYEIVWDVCIRGTIPDDQEPRPDEGSTPSMPRGYAQLLHRYFRSYKLQCGCGILRQ